jgi:hypothetical protein
MSVNVQSMLDELRDEMSSFEASLPEISERDALDGLLGIKHALVERWKAQEAQAQAQWKVQALLDSESVEDESRDAPPWWGVVLVGTMSGLVVIPLSAGVGARWGAAVGCLLVAIITLLWYLWLPKPESVPNVIPDFLSEKKVRIDEDPVFLIDEVQAYVREQIDTAHGRFSEIRTEFEKAVIHPRAKAETTLVTLRQKRQEAQGRQFPDEDQILAQIDKYIAECERLLNPSFDEERVAKQLRDTGDQLQALYKYPAQLEQVKAAYQSQADFVADLDDVGVDIDAIQSSRSTTMMAVASQP